METFFIDFIQQFQSLQLHFKSLRIIMQGWEMSNKTRQTYFTSDFYDFTNPNENSQTEDFDISQQYLKSQLSEKSLILKELNQQYFLKTLQVYRKVCLYASLCIFISKTDSWRKVNEKQKFQESRNPMNMTKIFIKVFYLLNKKIRTKVQKSFVKIHNFTKNHDMKTYETPIVKGIKKLNETFQMMNQKYFYNHPITSQQIVNQAFYEILFRVRTSKNRKQIQRMVYLINKMESQISLRQFHGILGEWQKSLQKLQILVGSLNLFFNPLKRDALQELKRYESKQKISFFIKKPVNDINNESIDMILNEPCKEWQKQDFQQVLDDQIKQREKPIEKQNDFEVIQQKDWILTVQNEDEKTPQKRSLQFSKDLRRKMSNEKKNKLKFKTIPVNSPKDKNTQKFNQNLENITDQQLYSIQNLNESVTKTINNLAQFKEQILLTVNTPKINLEVIKQSLKSKRVSLSFENSLSFQSKSSRNITVNEESTLMRHLKPEQLRTSFPDYLDISSYSDMPSFIQFNHKQNTQVQEKKYISLKEKNKTSPSKGFKSTKSGKSITFLQPKLPSNLSAKPNDYVSLKPSLGKPDEYLPETYKFKTQYNQPINKNTFQEIQQLKKIKKSNKNPHIPNQSHDNSSQYAIKHQYLFPISQQKNSSLGIMHKIVSKSKRYDNHIFSEYQSHPFQASVEKCQNAKLGKITSQNGKTTLLSFNTTRPMKKVKSGGKDSITKVKSPQNKKQKKSKEKHSKSKKAKQIKSQYYESQNQSSHAVINRNKQIDSGTLSVKSLKGSLIERPKVKSIGNKVMKTQK